MDTETSKLLIEFLAHLDEFYKELGVFTKEKTKKDIAREFCNKFYSNLICLQNYSITKDSMGAVLLLRYNHELVIDYYYLLDQRDEEDKINKFYKFNIKSPAREWSNLKMKEKRDFTPPWVADKESLTSAYKTLSTLAHSNIISIQLNRRGMAYEFNIIKMVISVSIMEISTCFNHLPFRKLFEEIEWVNKYDKNLEFQTRAINLLLN